MAFQTNIEFVRTGTVTMAVTLTLDRTIGTNVTKVTTANIGFDACASHAALRAHRYTNVPINNSNIHICKEEITNNLCRKLIHGVCIDIVKTHLPNSFTQVLQIKRRLRNYIIPLNNILLRKYKDEKTYYVSALYPSPHLHSKPSS